MTSIWEELKRRKVVKVAVAYAIVGWLLIEIASTVFPVLQIPDWAIALVTMLLLMGFPLALVLSWAFELTPEGMKRSHDVEVTESVAPVTRRKLDFAIIGALLLALGFVVADNYLLEGDSEPASGILPNSVAVLPFGNLSPDPDNSYYASGIHEEILNQLVKLSALNVIARTSMQQYANTDKSIPEIASELNVETVMEGSVRYDSGGRIRITAQLNDGATGAHLWSETYTRDFEDIFAIESDVAMNVANALEAEFSLAEQESIQKIPTRSAPAYALYLQALSSPTTFESPRFLDEAIELDPEFALAYALRTVPNALALLGVGAGVAPDEALQLERRVYEDAERALSIDPTIGLAHAALAVVHQANWRGTAAELAFQRSVELSPNDVFVLVQYGRFKRHRGERDAAVRLHRRAVELDPNSPVARGQLGITYRHFGAQDDSAAALQNVVNRYPANATWNAHLGYTEAARGNAAEAVRLLQRAERLGPPPVYRLAQMAHAYALVGRSDDARRLFAQFEERATDEGVGDAWWATAYIAVNDYEQALRRIASSVNGRISVDQIALTLLAENPWGDPELNTPEFRALLGGLWDGE